MNGCARWGRLFGVLALTCFGVRLAMAQEVAPPPLPVEPYKKNDKGLVVVEVKFAADGKVDGCRILRSNAPYPLEASTVDYIRRKWVNEALAGATVTLPIEFDELPWYAKHWNEGLLPPPNLLPADDPGRTLKLRITFDENGWISHVTVVQPTGIDLVDRETAVWVKVHWHSDKYAGQTVDTPFDFKSPVKPKPAVAREPAKPKPAPVPEEPAAPPAVRVE